MYAADRAPVMQRLRPRRGMEVARALPLLVAGFFVLTTLIHLYGAPSALAGLLVPLVVVFMLVRPHVATVAAVALLYVNLPAILTNRLGVPTLVAGAVMGLLFIPLMHALFVKGERILVDRTFGWMLGLLAVMLASTMAAVDHAIAFEQVTSYLLEGLVLYWLVINAIRTRHALHRVVWTLLMAGALLGTLALYQEVTRSYQQEFGGLAHRNYIESEATGEAREDRRRTWDRAQGPVNEPNRFAQILIVLLPLALYLHRGGRRSTAKAVALLAGLLVLAGVILTLSRGAFFALVALCLAMMALRWLRPRHVLTGMVLLVLLVPALTPFYSDRLLSIVGIGSMFASESQQEIDGAIRGRTTVMLSALHVFADHPVLGVGPAQFGPFYVRDYTADLDVRLREIHTPRRAHSLYLEIAAEMGAIGLAVFLAILLGLVRALWRERRRWLPVRPENADLATAVLLSLVAYCLTAVFLHLSYQRYLWLLVGVAGATLQLLRREGDAEAALRTAFGEGADRAIHAAEQ